MKIFLDTADLKEIEYFAKMDLIDGVTTNPSIIAKSGMSFKNAIKEICNLLDGEISAEVIATEHHEMLAQAHELSEISPNIVIKLPLTKDGIMTCSVLAKKNIKTNVTLCFSSSQATLAAKANATFISPFVGRLDDLGLRGVDLISDIRKIYDNYNFETQILAASIRSIEHINEISKIGADAITLPPKLLHEMFEHSLTDKGLKAFLHDWESSNMKF